MKTTLDTRTTHLILILEQIYGISDRAIVRSLNSVKDKNSIDDTFDFTTQLSIPKLARLISQHKLSRAKWDKLAKQTKHVFTVAHQLHVHLVNFLSTDYPQNLLTVATKHYPAILYVKGNLQVLNQKSVALVGTRDLSKFGASLTRKYAKFAVKHGFATVAGLAYGTDEVGEWATIYAGGHCIAIMANGLDQPLYPKPNAKLARAIISTGGAIVSPYPFGSKLARYTFVDRDRWQSGMANGTIAVETGMKGGTNHTMQFTRKQGRPLGVPNYDKYFNTTNLPNKSFGTQYDINHDLATSLYTRGDVKKFFSDLN